MAHSKILIILYVKTIIQSEEEFIQYGFVIYLNTMVYTTITGQVYSLLRYEYYYVFNHKQRHITKCE